MHRESNNLHLPFALGKCWRCAYRSMCSASKVSTHNASTAPSGSMSTTSLHARRPRCQQARCSFNLIETSHSIHHAMSCGDETQVREAKCLSPLGTRTRQTFGRYMRVIRVCVALAPLIRRNTGLFARLGMLSTIGSGIGSDYARFAVNRSYNLPNAPGDR